MKVYDLLEVTYELVEVEIIRSGYTGETLYKGRADKVPSEMLSRVISFISTGKDSIVIFL